MTELARMKTKIHGENPQIRSCKNPDMHKKEKKNSDPAKRKTTKTMRGRGRGWLFGKDNRDKRKKKETTWRVLIWGRRWK